MNPDKIPLKLRQRNSWVSFHIGDSPNGNGKPTKTPYIPGTDRKASATDPSTWRSFEEAFRAGNPAYCLTKEDSLIVIDLDGNGKEPCSERLAEQIMGFFEGTYQEVSQSGSGVHILLEGTLQGETGYNRRGVEMYCHSRFIILTGDVIEGETKICNPNPAALEQMELEMMTGKIRLIDMEEMESSLEDEEVILLARERYDRFPYLWEGRWEEFKGTAHGLYPSQSEADNDFIRMLAEVTCSNEQVARLFKRSGMFRSKKTPNYVVYTLRWWRGVQQKDREADEFVKELLASNHKKMDAVKKEHDWSKNDPELFTSIPPGLLKDLYHAFQGWAFLPLKEGSLVAAIVVCLVLFSRRYQTETGRALNLWLFLLGRPGSGKEIISEGVATLFRDCKAPVQGVLGGEPRSGPAMEELMQESPRHVAYIAECDAWIKSLCDDRGGPVWTNLRSVLTSLFTKGASCHMRRIVSQGKDRKNGPREMAIDRPCLSLYGDCPETRFYEAVGSNQVSSGFVPRFSVLQVDRVSVSMKPGKQEAFPYPIQAAIQRLSIDAMKADTAPESLGMATPAIRVPMRVEARQRWDTFFEECRQAANRDNISDMLADLLTRRAEKAMKIATLLAVCRDQKDPWVELADMEWALLFVKNTDGRMANQLLSGVYDTAQNRQLDNVRRILEEARFMPTLQRAKAKWWNTEKALHNPAIVPYGWIRERINMIGCFKFHRGGPQIALAAALKDLEHSGEVCLVAKEDALAQFGTKQALICNLRDPQDPEIEY